MTHYSKPKTLKYFYSSKSYIGEVWDFCYTRDTCHFFNKSTWIYDVPFSLRDPAYSVDLSNFMLNNTRAIKLVVCEPAVKRWGVLLMSIDYPKYIQAAGMEIRDTGGCWTFRDRAIFYEHFK